MGYVKEARLRLNAIKEIDIINMLLRSKRVIIFRDVSVTQSEPSRTL